MTTTTQTLANNGWTAEKVEQSYEIRPGRITTERFWIVYPTYVGGLGLCSDRISRAVGKGKTQAKAITAALAE